MPCRRNGGTAGRVSAHGAGPRAKRLSAEELVCLYYSRMTPLPDDRDASAGREDASGTRAPSWESLAERILSGDAEAEAELVRYFHPRVRAVASGQLRWSDAAADIAQDVLVSVIEALRSGAVRDPARLPAFVAGTARNLINNYRRKRARTREVLGNEPPDRPADYDLELASAERERLDLVRASFRALAAIDRRILLLTLVDGLNPREIAPVVGLSAEAVRTRKSRAVQAVAEAFRDRDTKRRSGAT